MALSHRSQARHQQGGSIVTYKVRATWSIDGENLVGERKRSRYLGIPLHLIDVAEDVRSLRGRALSYRPFTGRILRLEFTVDGVEHLLGIPMPDPAPWIRAIDAARR